MGHLVQEVCDLLVIGGGPGGFVCADRASAKYGAKTILVESARLGGTCVNAGCKPKKMLWNAATLQNKINDAESYGFTAGEAKLDWAAFTKKRDAFIKDLTSSQQELLLHDKVKYMHGLAEFVDPYTVKVTLDHQSEVNIKAKHILVAVGGQPNMPSTEGAHLGITSDGFFELNEQPRKAAIVGAGYIAVEMAGMLSSLGTETHLFIRQDKFLRPFDPMIQDCLLEEYLRMGIVIHRQSSVTKLESVDNKMKRLHYRDTSGTGSEDFDTVLWAVGRSAATARLNLSAAGIQVNAKQQVKVDELQMSNLSHVCAVGDACDRGHDLTPVAIAASNLLADRLFGAVKSAKLDQSNIPSVIFAHPEAGSIGMTEPEARSRFDQGNVKVYTSSFVDLYYAPMEDKDRIHSRYKLICVGQNEQIVGLHIVGQGSSEILQGFAVAVRMGATKADFDRCVAIHPTSAEELVTMK